MTGAAAFRGQPLLLLAGVLVGWLGLRIALWETPLHRPAATDGASVRIQPAHSSAVASVPLPAATAGGELLRTSLGRPMYRTDRPATGAATPAAMLPAVERAIDHPAPTRIAELADSRGAADPGVPAAAPLLIPPMRAEAGTTPARRWSADSWLLLRHDTAASSLAGRPSYGRSQAGAVVRYDLAPASALRPTAYLRASAALAGAGERELAAGASLRPLPRLPLRLAVEARVGETGAGTRLRPAAYAVSELPPLALPLGARAETYFQGGYVGGEFATAFVDGQLRIERPLVRLGETGLSAGGGAWGGAQEGSARLDVGPTAAVALRLGKARGRIAADYRFRVAGDAEPASGPALTLSAGF